MAELRGTSDGEPLEVDVEPDHMFTPPTHRYLVRWRPRGATARLELARARDGATGAPIAYYIVYWPEGRHQDWLDAGQLRALGILLQEAADELEPNPGHRESRA